MSSLLPDDVLVHVFDFLQTPWPLALVNRRLHELWSSNAGGGWTGRSLLWLNVQVDPFTALAAPVGLGAPRTLTLRVRHWGAQLGRTVSSVQHSLTRLVLTTAGAGILAREAALVAVCEALPPTLRVLEVHLPDSRLGDGSLSAIGAAAAGPCITRAVVRVPINRITIAGLRAFAAHVCGAPALHDLELDVSGNYIRGPEYGVQVARLAQPPALTDLAVTFGGWAMRKQFGLQALAGLADAVGLRRLALTLLGARVTCEAFKKAVFGIARLPRLESLELNLSHSDVGEQCNRGLALLRFTPSLRRVSVSLDCPSPRLLSALGGWRHVPTIEHIELNVDQALRPLQHAQLEVLERLARIPEMHVTVRRVRTGSNDTELCLGQPPS